MIEKRKKCKHCGFMLLLDEFNRRSDSSDGLQSYCRDCSNATALMSVSRGRQRSAARLEQRNRWSRARNAAVRELIDRHGDEYAALLDIAKRCEPFVTFDEVE